MDTLCNEAFYKMAADEPACTTDNCRLAFESQSTPQ